jgi:hypothetical protein
MKEVLLSVVVVAALAVAASAISTSATAATHGTVWLCKPGALSNPCTVNPDVSVVSSTGASTVVHRVDDAKSKFDCFYVYPTVSGESGPNSDLKIQSSEVNVAFAQASAFSTVCRVWAPMYRQRTLGSLFRGNENFANNVAYASLLSAWKEYLAHDNHGRPVILIGHSQGAAMLIRLLHSQFDTHVSLQSKLVSALVIGGNVTVKSGQLTGGSFSHVALCSPGHSIVGCVTAYSSFASTPPPTSFFGIPGQGVSALSNQTATLGLSVACVSPVDFAAPGAGAPVALTSQFPATTVSSVASISVSTAWVQYRDLYSAHCEQAGNATWLQVNTTASLKDVRPLVSEAIGANWGYHVDDVGLLLGNLVSAVSTQEAAYLILHPHAS